MKYASEGMMRLNICIPDVQLYIIRIYVTN